MELTKLSTKGQVVIPEASRKDLEIGTAFVVTRKEDLIILKKVAGLTKEEMKELEELDKIWKDIATGACESYSEEEFFEQMKKW
tara:strand:- start:397 stop:648 length:252 start_codon:yes stop_codon:yes gene_type:complete